MTTVRFLEELISRETTPDCNIKRLRKMTASQEEDKIMGAKAIYVIESVQAE